jgi:glucose/arabinose dehydrogenase/PKD repeat protein
MQYGRAFPCFTVTFGAALALVSELARAHAQGDVDDARFAHEVLHVGPGMISIEFAPDGRLYVCEKDGRVLTFAPDGAGGYEPPTEFMDLDGDVFTEGESGLLGLALDPAFASNRHVYLFHTSANEQRLIRVTANAAFDAAMPGSMLVLLDGLPRSADYHKAGDIQFQPGEPDAIYVGIGDDGNPQWAQNLDRYNGKILRVSTRDGLGLSDNPFANGDLDSVRSRVWAHGLRNPYRFVFHPSGEPADVVYLSENGDATDRVSRVQMGSNGGWNESGDGGGFLAPSDRNHRVLWTEDPVVVGITIDDGGVFADQGAPDSSTLFVSNGLTGGIYRYRLDGAALDSAQPLDGGQPFVRGLLAFGAVDMTIGPDGALYYTRTSNDASSPEFELGRVRLANGDPPSASFTPSTRSGGAPLTVSFDDTSSDPDGALRAWSWDFGDGATSSEQNPTHEYTRGGVFTVTLRVTDESGLRDQAQDTIEVTREFTLALTGHLIDARGQESAALDVASELRLYDGDVARPLAIDGGGNTIAVPAGGEITAELAVEATAEHLLISAGEPDGDGVAAAFSAVAWPESGGLEHELTFHLSSTALRGRVLDTRAEPAVIDLGALRGEPPAPYQLPGGRDVLARGARAQTGVAHRIVSDALGHYYFAIREDDAGRFSFDLLADTGRDRYTGEGFALSIASQEAIDREIVVGLLSGGRDCDDLSGVAATAYVDFARHIQPIWEARCTGCHTDVADNSGGLDLQQGSRERLVGVRSAFVPGVALVEPGVPERSYLMEKINCADPQDGERMAPTDAMPLAEQALVRDWIAQLPGGPGGSGGSTGGQAAQGASSDGGAAGAGAQPSSDGGCDCSAAPGAHTARQALLSAWLLLLLACALRARRRRERAR